MAKYNLILDGTTSLEYRGVEAETFIIESVGTAPTASQFYVFTAGGTVRACFPVNRVISMIEESSQR